jgi:transcription termination factor Rho
MLRHLKEVAWPKAYAEQDTILLDKILGEDFKMIDQAGNWFSKKDELEWIKKNATQNDSFHYEIKRFELLENGTALICGTGHIYKDSVKSIYQSSNVLIKREGMWKAVLSHVSGVKKID